MTCFRDFHSGFEAPLLTIATINKNNASGLQKTIDSVLSQKDARVEYVILDGLSSDGSCNIALKYENELDFFESNRDKGISDAFNRSLAASHGKWLLLLNSGDCLAKHSLSGVCDQLEFASSDLVLFSTKISGGVEDGKILKPLYSKLRLEMSIPHPSAFVRRDVYEKYGGYDLNYRFAMDYEFFLRSRNKLIVTEIDSVATIMDGFGVSSQGVWRRNIECWRARKKNDFNAIVNVLYTARRLLREAITMKGLIWFH